MVKASSPQEVQSKIYPQIKVERIKNPSRFYAFPVVGGFSKMVILIPVYLELCFVLGLAMGALQLVNSFVVLFTGKYWKPCYNITLDYMRYSLKLSYFWKGMTDKYPGFGLGIDDNFSLEMEMPVKPGRMYAIPIVGFIERLVLLIPYFVYGYFIRYAAMLGTVISSFIVLGKGYYPETTFELNRDSIRLSQSLNAYFSGMSDAYPSFWISMNHRNMKLLLIIIVIVYFLFSNIFKSTNKNTQHNYNNYYKSLPSASSS